MKVVIQRILTEEDENIHLRIIENNGKKVWFGEDNDKTCYIKFVEYPKGTIENIELSADIMTDIDNIKSQIHAQLIEIIEDEQSGLESIEEYNVLDPVPYDPKKIKIRNENWSIKYIYELITEYKDVNLAPDFQREFIWDAKRKSRLIESLILGIPIPAFYLAENEKGKLHVVDGLQRLTVINGFLNNEFSLRNLEYLASECNGSYFKANGKKRGLEFEYVKRILQTQINVNIIEASSPLKVKYDVFRRINTGGKPLNNQEIRNCLAEPHTRELINSLARTEEFIAATGGSIKTTRMDAQEMVLRFIGLYYINNIVDLVLPQERILEYKGDMQGFLDDCIGKLNRDNGKYHDILKDAFFRSMKNAYHLFGEYSFRKCFPSHLEPGVYRQLVNKSLYMTWSILLANYDTDKVRENNNFKSFAYHLAEELINNSDYWLAVSLNTGDKNNLDIAFENGGVLINEFLKYE